MAYRIFIDNGGTFTDGVCVNEKGDLVTAKSSTTPKDLANMITGVALPVDGGWTCQ